MADTVRRLEPVAQQPDKDLVRCVEELLERVKSGEIIGIAYTSETRGGFTEGCWGLTRHGSFARLVGGLRLLEERVLRAWEH